MNSGTTMALITAVTPTSPPSTSPATKGSPSITKLERYSPCTTTPLRSCRLTNSAAKPRLKPNTARMAHTVKRISRGRTAEDRSEL